MMKEVHERPRPMKEADHIKLHALPNTVQFKHWRTAVRDEVIGASGRGEAAFHWIVEVEKPGATYEAMANVGQFESLDGKLSAALTKIMTGELGRKVNQIKETGTKEGILVRGRQVLWLVYDHYRINDELGLIYDFRDLNSVKMRGDSLESFLNSWENVLLGMQKQPDEDILRALFLEQIRNSLVIKEELCYFDRLKTGHEDKSYAFLHETVRAYLERKRLKDNRRQLEAAFNGGAPGRPSAGAVEAPSKKVAADPALPAKGKGKGKPKKSASPTSSEKGVCYDFVKTGTCSRGDSCKYSHTKERHRSCHLRERARARA